MMMLPVEMLFDTPRRTGYLTEPKLLRAVLPSRVIGTYLLLKSSKPIYVGRSDSCLLTRLCNHELLDQATHVVWEPCESAKKAFCLEASWYHCYAKHGMLLNQIHPAKPAGYEKNCPFCGKRDREALKFALPRLYEAIAA